MASPASSVGRGSCDVDEFGFNPGALPHFPGDKAGRVQAHAAHPGRAQDHRNEQGPTCVHEVALHFRDRMGPENHTEVSERHLAAGGS